MLTLLQIAVILLACRAFAWIFARIRQPRVVGEMAAGIALGPTLFGALSPRAFAWLFPATASASTGLGLLDLLSRAGLIVFVFLLGLHVDFGELRRQSRAALFCGIAGIAAPLGTGLAIAPGLFRRYGHGDAAIFALFIGTSLSVTAFPVLARILSERGMTRSRVGMVAIAGAGLSDVAAWMLLAVILAMTAHSQPSARSLSLVTLPFAFAAGLFAAPRKISGAFTGRLEQLVAAWLLPLFFALTGLKTDLILPSGGYLDLAVILAAAIAGKWGGAFLGARMGGMGAREACQAGILMNARGLVELIVLNIGLSAGILTPPLFSMMVSMALFTTLLTSPLLDLF